MLKTNGQLARGVKRVRVEWDEGVTDSRDRRGIRHKHRGLLNLLVFGFACGQTTLRGIEDLSSDLSAVARRMLGLAKRVSDTTLFLLLGGQQVRGFRETLVAQVKTLLRNGRVKNDLFRFGVVAFDGKTPWASTSRTVEGAKVSKSRGVTVSSLSTERAVLVSATPRPVLDLELIQSKSGESPAFRVMFQRVVKAFGSAFDIITADAGLTCRENALFVRLALKHYVFALKGNQQKLFELAQRVFNQPLVPRVQTSERRGGELITRTLFGITVRDVPEVDVYGAEQLWCLHQVTQPDEGAPTTEVRFFITSIPPKMLSPTEQLALIRLHWGIENSHHWTLDAIFKEDDRQPCQLSSRSIELVCWLRALAYNIVAPLRARAPLKDNQPQPWRRTIQLLRDLLVTGREEILPACLA